MPERLTFLFTPEELTSIFGDLCRAEKIKQRIFHLNKLGENLGIRLSFSSVDSTLAIHCPSLNNGEKLKERLAVGKGHIQRAIGQALSKKLSVIKKPNAELFAFLLRHASWWKEVFEQTHVAGIPFLDIWIETEASEQTKQSLANNPWQSFLILGQAAAGKSAFLFKTFYKKAQEKLEHGDGLPLPVYIPASHLCFDLVAPESFLGSLAGIRNDSKRELIALLEQGKIFFFIDGLDENPGCVDFSNPQVNRFWNEVSKNTCILSSRDDFWRRSVKKASFGQFFAKIKTITLGEWSLEEIRVFLRQAAKSLKSKMLTEISSCLEHLSKLDSSNLEKVLEGVAKTPFVLNAFAQFVRDKKAILPKENGQFLDFLFKTTLQWETGKPNFFLDFETTQGVFAKIALGSKLKSKAKNVVTTKNLWNSVLKDYPFLQNQGALEFFSSVQRLPFIKYNGEEGTFSLQTQWADLLNQETSSANSKKPK